MSLPTTYRDDLPPNQYVHFVRHTLVHTGALPERDEDLERTPPWLEELLVEHPQHARLLRPYLHWYLLRRARPRAARPGHTHGSGRAIRRKIRVALEFLQWLEHSSLALLDVRQADVDRWLVASTTCRYDLRSFLTWTRARGLSQDLHVPVRPRAQPELVLDEDERWQLLDRCLTDHDMPLDTRAAGALILLLGLPLTRICRLTADQFTQRGKNTYLLAGRHDTLLPPAITGLLQQLAKTPHTRAQLVHAHRGTAWLFPGLAPGQPIGAETLAAELRTFGIRPRPARNAAWPRKHRTCPPRSSPTHRRTSSGLCRSCAMSKWRGPVRWWRTWWLCTADRTTTPHQCAPSPSGAPPLGGRCALVRPARGSGAHRVDSVRWIGPAEGGAFLLDTGRGQGEMRRTRTGWMPGIVPGDAVRSLHDAVNSTEWAPLGGVDAEHGVVHSQPVDSTQWSGAGHRRCAPTTRIGSARGPGAGDAF
ncbi:hypothetical protein [Streptomyces lydicus]|uniref:hypothetical protein n=1 Tax=Streptomyces lydicus TaxID=47763 RepID=UPI0037880A38